MTQISGVGVRVERSPVKGSLGRSASVICEIGAICGLFLNGFRGLESVVTRRVVVKEHLALGYTKVFANLAKSRVEGVEVAVEFVHGEIAGEHASGNTKGLNCLQDERA